MKGHWFCNGCDDVVIMPAPVGRWDAKRNVKCPVCHNYFTDWISTEPKKLSTVTAAKLFADMKKAIE